MAPVGSDCAGPKGDFWEPMQSVCTSPLPLPASIPQTPLSVFTKSFGIPCDEGVQAIITGARIESRRLVCFLDPGLFVQLHLYHC